MQFHEYMSGLAHDLQHQSDKVREAFKTHRPSAGRNREALVAEFIEPHLPKAFGIGTGLVISRDTVVSQEADVVIFDQTLNAPLHPELPTRRWLCEAVYAVIEVKTNLTPSELSDSIAKCRRFKNLDRQYLEGSMSPAIRDSLFIIWAFEAASPEKMLVNFAKAIADVPVNERPDFLIVPNSMIGTSGSYFELSKFGQPQSPYRVKLEEENIEFMRQILARGFNLWDMGENSLMTFFIWFNSWLQYAGRRTTSFNSYLPKDMIWGKSL